MSELTLRDRVSRSDIQEGLKVEPSLLCSQKELRAFWGRLGEVFQAWEETLGQTQERLCLLAKLNATQRWQQSDPEVD